MSRHEASRSGCRAGPGWFVVDRPHRVKEPSHGAGGTQMPFTSLRAGDQEAVAGLLAALASTRRLGVAFSGGVDSSVLLALAARALGPERVIAVLGVSASLAADERVAAHAVAASIGVDVVEVQTHEGDRAEYRRNDVDRCFHCKDELFTRISQQVVVAHGLTAVAYGENADDARRPDRPGSRAATKHAVPCLASRIPHHFEVTPEKLAQVEAAESELRRLGLRDLRVRHHGDVARLEVPVEGIAAVATPPLRDEVVRVVRAAGFRFVALDLMGVQSGAFTLALVGVRGV